MRCLIDACVPRQLVLALKAHGADVEIAAGRPAPTDDVILASATGDDRIVVTNDKDFGELVFLKGSSAAGVILIRFDIVSQTQAEQTALRILSLPSGGRGSFTVLEAGSTRSRPLAPNP